MKKETIFIIIGVILFIWLYISLADFTPKNEQLLDKITELENKIDSLNNKKDSIRTIIDSTHVKIITNEKHFQERINTIIVQSDSDNLIFFKDYINNYGKN